MGGGGGLPAKFAQNLYTWQSVCKYASSILMGTSVKWSSVVWSATQWRGNRSLPKVVGLLSQAFSVVRDGTRARPCCWGADMVRGATDTACAGSPGRGDGAVFHAAPRLRQSSPRQGTSPPPPSYLRPFVGDHDINSVHKANHGSARWLHGLAVVPHSPRPATAPSNQRDALQPAAART